MRMPRIRSVAAVLSALALVAGSAPRVVAQDAPPPLYRIFLTDGTSVTSYGEYARVGERVVFSLPLGGTGSSPALHLASVPVSRVDWPATTRYQEAARATYYGVTRGEDDYAAMSGEVARVLNDIAVAPDAAARLALAERARRTLVSWPAEHYSYRAEEVRQMLTLLDEVVSELRAQTGQGSFELALVANVLPPPVVPMLPPPSLQESVAQALHLADVAETPVDRTSLLQAVATLIDRNADALPDAWRKAMGLGVAHALERERLIDRDYAALRTRALEHSARAAAQADVRGVERALDLVRRGDARLGGRRPQDVDSLMTTLTARLDAARRLRLARDNWALNEGPLRRYRQLVSRTVGELGRARGPLDDIRTLAGPDSAGLDALDRRIVSLSRDVRVIAAPSPAAAAHSVLTTAVQLAANAVRLRRRAITSGDLNVAWDASAAAAGALMMLDRARDELARAFRPPDAR